MAAAGDGGDGAAGGESGRTAAVPATGPGAAPPALDCEALGVDVLGPIPLDHLHIVVEDGLRVFPPEIQEAADAHWQAMILERPKLFDGPSWGLVGRESLGPGDTGAAGADAGVAGIRLRLQLSSYKYTLFTHYTPQGHALPPEARTNAIGVMGLTETSDGLLVVGRRSHHVGACPGYWHCVPAGGLDEPDPVPVFCRELQEELFVSSDGLCGLEWLALMPCGQEQGDKPEFVFRLRLGVTAAELLRRRDAAVDSWEHEAIGFIRAPHGAAAAEEASSREAVPAMDMERFLAGAEGPVTDITRRAMLLLQALRPPPVAPWHGDAPPAGHVQRLGAGEA